MHSTPLQTNPMTDKPGFSSLQQAAYWYAEVENIANPKTYPAALQNWLEENHENQLAWQYVHNISQRFSSLRENGSRQTAALEALTLTSHNAGRRSMLKIAAWISAGSLMGWGSWRYTPLRNQVLAWRADYQSPHGAITQFTLSDGTRIWLDTDSAVSIDYSPTQRLVKLLNGRVMIKTAADQQRPFIVSSAQGNMHALGTSFSVQTRNDTTVLLVYHGAVKTSPATISNKLIIKAGQAVSFREDAFGPLVPLQNAEPAWPQGLLQAQSLKLSEFIEQLSAYRKGYLGCEPAVAALTITGTFPLHNTDMALEMLTKVLPVQLNRRFSWWVTVGPRA